MTSELEPQAPPLRTPSPALDGGTIPLPSAPNSAAERRRGRGFLDGVLDLLVLALAFLAASFLARNSDLWFHLATGRLLAKGQFSFGADPFSYTTLQAYWACHSWLFDLALYALHGLIGGAGLVVLKALLVTVLAGFLLNLRRPAGFRWLPVLCTTLAILAMSPRLLLQPSCVSYFLFGLTFWLLWRAHARHEAGQRAGFLSFSVSLLLLFVLWANVDEWFLLGPLLAALFWLGERLRGQRVTPGWLPLAGLVVCLLNPYTYHAFTLPDELSIVTWTSGLRNDPRFQSLFASPWQQEFLHAAGRLNAAALAYFILTFLSAASFLLHRPALRDWRLLVWLPFAVLAAWQARTIPFFAIVAAPITALNGQDYLATRGIGLGWRFRSIAGRLTLALGLLALLALMWLGWLAGYDREDRHVAWGIEIEPSLQQAAETLDHWRSHGLLRDGERVFTLAPEMAQYGAWFCPEEKNFFDHRYPLYPEAAREYETISRALLPELEPARSSKSATASAEGAGDWRQLLRKRGVSIVVYYDRQPERLFGVLSRLAEDKDNWTLLHVAGQALIVGWNKARPGGGFAPLAFDPARLAFGPQDDAARREAPAAPDDGPAQLPSRRGFWDRLARPPAAPTWESAAATMYLHYFNDIEADQRRRQWKTTMVRYAAGLVAVPAQPAAIPQAVFQLVASREMLVEEDAPRFLVREQLGPFFAQLVERPPDLPLLAIRTARRAVAADPRDVNAWLRLGQAYLLLRNATVERSSDKLLPPLAQLRQVQIITALEEAVRLHPDLEEAHHQLFLLYGELKALDRALDHQREELRISRRAGPRPGESAENFTYRIESLEKDTAKLVELVESRRKSFAGSPRSPQGDRLAQVRLALDLGLAKTAVEEVLLPTPADLLGAPGIQTELELLLSLGRAEEVRAILDNEALQASKHGLGHYNLLPPSSPNGGPLYALPYRLPAYEWLHVLEAAAVGDYAKARAELRAIRAALQADLERHRREDQASERRLGTHLPGLWSGPPPFLPAYTFQTLVPLVVERIVLELRGQALIAQQADVAVIEGLLALERGDVQTARSAFADADKQMGPTASETVPCAGRPIVNHYLGELNARSHASAKQR